MVASSATQAVNETVVRTCHVASRTSRGVGMPARVITYVEEVFTVVNTCVEEAFAIL
jgi:hypothetical protein